MNNTTQEKPGLFFRFVCNLLTSLFSVIIALLFMLIGTGFVTGIVYLCKLCYGIIFGQCYGIVSLVVCYYTYGIYCIHNSLSILFNLYRCECDNRQHFLS